MNLLGLFGIGSDEIISKATAVPGTVTTVSRCWWLKVNTKAIRSHSLDGALFPHIITFEYTVDSVSYQGKRWVGVRHRVPQPGESIAIYYDPVSPCRYACAAFGPGPYAGITWR